MSLNLFAVTDENDIRTKVGWDEKYGEKLLSSSPILDLSGFETSLDNELNPEIPTIIVFAYYSCPKMCSFTLQGVEEAVIGSERFRPGKDYNLVTISIDEKETSKAVLKYEQKYNQKLAKDEYWKFYSAPKNSIDLITSSVGYKFMPDGGEFAHPAGIIFVTKDKIVSRYLSGVIFDPKDFKLALLEASEGTVGKVSLSDKVLLYCYDFDPVGKKYALKALNVMKLGGAITLISLIILMIFLWTKKQGGSK
ncbi:MAG: hypothetical protein CBC86_0001340 [Deltaproteobacteria bacterium TMED126]|nr:hypothetical protein [Candidatus Dadabacteria bacterium]NSW97241.1 hypothetical protein [Deltaproteobacteria bacterium TMED126]